MDREKWMEYLKTKLHKYQYVLIVCLVGLALCAWPTGGQKEKAAEPAAADSAAALERELEEILSSMAGVGKTKVALTARSSRASVYAFNEDETVSDNGSGRSADRRTTLVSFGASGIQQPVTVRVDEPEYRGALVVCQGADSALVRLEVTKAVSSLTGITSDNIVVSKMK